jgi:hypothetical protein
MKTSAMLCAFNDLHTPAIISNATAPFWNWKPRQCLAHSTISTFLPLFPTPQPPFETKNLGNALRIQRSLHFCHYFQRHSPLLKLKTSAMLRAFNDLYISAIISNATSPFESENFGNASRIHALYIPPLFPTPQLPFETENFGNASRIQRPLHFCYYFQRHSPPFETENFGNASPIQRDFHFCLNILRPMFHVLLFPVPFPHPSCYPPTATFELARPHVPCSTTTSSISMPSCYPPSNAFDLSMPNVPCYAVTNSVCTHAALRPLLNHSAPLLHLATSSCVTICSGLPVIMVFLFFTSVSVLLHTVQYSFASASAFALF